MTHRRRLLLTVAAVVAIGSMPVVVLLVMMPRSGVTKDEFDRIKKGMTEDDAVAIFGRPPTMQIEAHFHFKFWRNENGTHALLAFRNGRVEVKEWGEPPDTFPGRLRRWVHPPK